MTGRIVASFRRAVGYPASRYRVELDSGEWLAVDDKEIRGVDPAGGRWEAADAGAITTAVGAFLAVGQGSPFSAREENAMDEEYSA